MLNAHTFVPQALREQYPERNFKIQDIYMVKFANRNSNTALEIEIYRRQAATAGWQIALLSSKVCTIQSHKKIAQTILALGVAVSILYAEQCRRHSYAFLFCKFTKRCAKNNLLRRQNSAGIWAQDLLNTSQMFLCMDFIPGSLGTVIIVMSAYYSNTKLLKGLEIIVALISKSRHFSFSPWYHNIVGFW